jgi:hypothetical protein
MESFDWFGQPRRILLVNHSGSNVLWRNHLRVHFRSDYRAAVANTHFGVARQKWIAKTSEALRAGFAHFPIASVLRFLPGSISFPYCNPAVCAATAG